jgi:bisphosphoglycerate-independent phosphoglycerate mutase (AlkP superfamily)
MYRKEVIAEICKSHGGGWLITEHGNSKIMEDLTSPNLSKRLNKNPLVLFEIHTVTLCFSFSSMIKLAIK